MSFLSAIFGRKKRPLREAYEEAAQTIEAFFDGRSGRWDWDDFLSLSKEDSYLEDVAMRCNRVSYDYPTKKEENGYCNAEGIDVLRAIAMEVRDRLNAMDDTENA